MFTVKHITDGGSLTSEGRVENLYYGDKITFSPDAICFGPLEIRLGETLVTSLWGGMAYVMNPEGKTVARYDLPSETADKWRASAASRSSRGNQNEAYQEKAQAQVGLMGVSL
ncbi:hypothetical protein AB0L20_31820, partial [Streptomyces albidoflavus]|uniref:hypothetical protein n=1 Tax=Streptomyces albidoflavus TaxID=1886 RepID=UPI003424A8B5